MGVWQFLKKDSFCLIHEAKRKLKRSYSCVRLVTLLVEVPTNSGAEGHISVQKKCDAPTAIRTPLSDNNLEGSSPLM